MLHSPTKCENCKNNYELWNFSHIVVELKCRPENSESPPTEFWIGIDNNAFAWDLMASQIKIYVKKVISY